MSAESDYDYYRVQAEELVRQANNQPPESMQAIAAMALVYATLAKAAATFDPVRN